MKNILKVYNHIGMSPSQLCSTALGIRTKEGVCLAVEKRVQSTLMVPESMKKILKVDSHIGMSPSQLGSTAVGIRTKEGVCLAVEKRVQSTLMVLEFMKKILKDDNHIAVAYSGLIADSQTLVNKARVEAKNFWFVYGKPMKTSEAVSNLALEFGDDDAKASMSRPFGVALLFAGFDEEGPALYHMDPSGTYIGCLAKAIGAASEGAEQSLKDSYHESMTMKEAQKVALGILKQVMEEAIAPNNVEPCHFIPEFKVAEVVKSAAEGSPGEFRLLPEADLKKILDEL